MSAAQSIRMRRKVPDGPLLTLARGARSCAAGLAGPGSSGKRNAADRLDDGSDLSDDAVPSCDSCPGRRHLGFAERQPIHLGLDAGEHLNEHIVGAGWSGRGERHERLSEAIDTIQALLAGTLTNYRGSYFRLDHARMFDRPDPKPPVAGRGRRSGAPRRSSGDALIATEPRSDLIEAFVSNGGSGPRHAEVALCYAKREEDGRKTAHHYFRWSVAGWPVTAELPDTEGFAAASKTVSREAVAKLVSCGPSPEHHLQSIDRYVQAGFDHIILVQVGPEQEAFIEFFEHRLAPALGSRKAA
jgi:G6PDH family F420-dependent oxidoreductase